MPEYRRAWHPGGTYFFTVNLLQRKNNDLSTQHIVLWAFCDLGSIYRVLTKQIWEAA